MPLRVMYHTRVTSNFFFLLHLKKTAKPKALMSRHDLENIKVSGVNNIVNNVTSLEKIPFDCVYNDNILKMLT